MAKKEITLTKASLMKEIDMKLQEINLLKSVLLTNAHPKKDELEDYRKRFREIVG